MLLDGLRSAEDPFGTSLDSRYTYLDMPRRKGIARLISGLFEGNGLFLLVGRDGLGASTLLRLLADQVATLEGVVLLNPPPSISGFAASSFVEIFSACAPTLALPAERIEPLSVARRLQEIADRDGAPVLLIDDADRLAADTLEALSTISELRIGERRLLSGVLAGSPQLIERLAATADAAAAADERVVTVAPFSETDMIRLIRHRLRTAGVNVPEVFDAEMLATLARQSGGAPGTALRACRRALRAAETDGRREAATAKSGQPQVSEAAPAAAGQSPTAQLRAAPENATPPRSDAPEAIQADEPKTGRAQLLDHPQQALQPPAPPRTEAKPGGSQLPPRRQLPLEPVMLRQTLQDPALQDPALQDPALRDPALRDPALQDARPTDRSAHVAKPQGEAIPGPSSPQTLRTSGTTHRVWSDERGVQEADAASFAARYTDALDNRLLPETRRPRSHWRRYALAAVSAALLLGGGYVVFDRAVTPRSSATAEMRATTPPPAAPNPHLGLLPPPEGSEQQPDAAWWNTPPDAGADVSADVDGGQAQQPPATSPGTPTGTPSGSAAPAAVAPATQPPATIAGANEQRPPAAPQSQAPQSQAPQPQARQAQPQGATHAPPPVATVMHEETETPAAPAAMPPPPMPRPAPVAPPVAVAPPTPLVPPQPSTAAPTAAPPAVATHQAAAPSPTSARTTAHRREVDGLLEEGDARREEGDVDTARTMYEEAWSRGSAEAAMRMAETFDPRGLGSRDPQSSPAEAVLWYRDAARKGDRRARTELDGLAVWLENAAASGDEQARRVLRAWREPPPPDEPVDAPPPTSTE